MAEKCETCYYWQTLSAETNCCHYLLITKQMRGCSPSDCNKWKPKNKRQLKAQHRDALTKGMQGIL